jgi:ABC-type multidrug transport system ATPase subunit
MVQIIGIVQAMLHEPDLLLLDEPTGGLDPRAQITFARAVKDASSKGATVVISSHLLSSLEELCGQVAMLHNGNVLLSGTVDEIAGIRSCFTARIKGGEGLGRDEISARLKAAGLDADFVAPALKSLREVFLETAGGNLENSRG